MFRKVIHITLVIILLTTSMGMTLYMHYCGSTFISFSIDKAPHSCCDDICKDCHNKSVSIKIHDDYSASSFNFDFTEIGLALPTVHQPFIEELSLQPHLLVKVKDISPPPIQTILSSLQTFRL